ncbi:MAG TPA: DUF3592 domain-containing protein [Chitinophagaceae bacterium]|nr:DUF3592 domain-containing protein [Chitinophagaceae bacterium]
MRNALLILIAAAVVIMIPIYFVIPKGQANFVAYFLCVGGWLFVLIRDMSRYIQTRKGTYVSGTIVSVKGAGHNATEKLHVDFISPSDNQTYRILYETGSAMWEPETTNVEVWLNKTDPAKSVVVDRGSWVWNMVVHTVLFIVLTGAAVFLLWQ